MRLLNVFIHLRFTGIIILLILLSLPARSQPPIRVRMDTISQCPGTVSVAIKVENAANIGSITLRFHYNPAVLTYMTTNNVSPVLASGLTSYNDNAGWYAFTWWTLNTPISMPNNTLLQVLFSYTSGTSPLIWDTIPTEWCEWSDITASIIYDADYYNGEVNSTGFTASITSQPQTATICQGSSTSFSVVAVDDVNRYWQVSTNGGITWTTLSNVPPYSGVQTQTLNLNAPAPSYSGYKYRCILVGLCPPNSITTPVTLNIIQNATVSAGVDDSICAGDSAFILGNAGNYSSVQWSTSGSGSFTNTASLGTYYKPSPADTAAGLVTLTLTANGISPCSAKTDQMVLTILPLPFANAGEDTIVCLGDSVTLIAGGGISYAWNTGANTQSISVSPAVFTYYTVTVNQYGCTDSDTVGVDIMPQPVVIVNPDDNVCEGEQFQAGVQISNAISVIWTSSGDGGFSSPSSLTPIYTPGINDIVQGSVYLIASAIPMSPCSLPVKDSLLLTIIPLPHAYAGPDDSICIGFAATLAASGGSLFLWSTGQTTAGITVNPMVTTTYSVTVTELGCSAYDEVTVKVMLPPNVNAGNDTTICYNTSANLTVTGGVSYLWSTGATTSNLLVTPLLTTTYTVTATGANGCKNSDEVSVIVIPGLQISVTPQSAVLCDGEEVILTASANHNCAFTWSPPGGLNTTSGNVVIASPAHTQTYTLNGIDSQGCLANLNVTVTINPNPTLTVSPTTVTLCEFDTVTLVANGALTYHWEPPHGLSSNSMPQVQASPLQSTIYTIKGTDAIGCSSSTSVVVNIDAVPIVELPSYTVLCRGDNLLLDAGNLPDSCTYLWQDGGTLQYTYVSEPGIYWVQVSRKNCMVWDSTIIEPCSELFIPNAFTPNGDENNEYFFVGHNDDILEYSIYIYSRWGELVFHSRDIYEKWDGSFDGKICPPGIYHYVIEYLGRGNVLLEQEGKRYGQILLLR